MREDTTNAIKEFELPTVLGGKRNIEKAEELLDADEKVLCVVNLGYYVIDANTLKKTKFPGVVFLTNNRVLFHYQDMFQSNTQSVSLDEIRTINSNLSSLAGNSIELHTLTNTYGLSLVYKKEIAQKIVQVFEEVKKNFSGSNEPQENDILAQIEKLGELNKKGILTDEEFATKKEELLSRL